jgi:lysophospholipase L1-like esterase
MDQTITGKTIDIDSELCDHLNIACSLKGWEKGRDTVRIINMGDSVTEGECPQTDALQAMLNNADISYNGKTRFDVVNAGKGGRPITFHMQLLGSILEQNEHPDIITLLTGWNEHWYSYSFDPCNEIDCYDSQKVDMSVSLTKAGANMEFCDSCKNSLEKAAFNLLLEEREKCLEEIQAAGLESLIEDFDSYDTSIYRVPLDTYRETLRKFIHQARSHGIEVVLVVPPNGITKGSLPDLTIMDCTFLDAEAFDDVHRIYTDTIREIAESEQVPFIDIEKAFDSRPDRLSLFADPGFDTIHPNDEGDVLCTDVFFQTLTKEVLKTTR